MFSPWYLCMYCPVLCLSLVDMILFDMRYVGRFRNVRHIWLAAIFVRRHLECRPYLIPGSKVIWNLLSLLCVKLLSWILYLIRITVLLCVIGDRYEKSNHQCLITYTCRAFLMVSGLGGVILIFFVIIDEFWEFINKTLKALLVYIVTKTVVFIPDARPVFFVNMCGTAPSGLKPSQHAEMWCFNAMLLLLYLLCVMEVLWMCYECVKNVFWMCYECVVNVLRMCYGCVTDVLGMC